MTEPVVFTIPEAAQYLRISEASLYRRIKDGTVRVVKFGRITRVPKVALDQLLGVTERAS